MLTSQKPLKLPQGLKRQRAKTVFPKPSVTPEEGPQEDPGRARSHCRRSSRRELEEAWGTLFSSFSAFPLHCPSLMPPEARWQRSSAHSELGAASQHWGRQTGQLSSGKGLRVWRQKLAEVEKKAEVEEADWQKGHQTQCHYCKPPVNAVSPLWLPSKPVHNNSFVSCTSSAASDPQSMHCGFCGQANT